MHPVNLEVLANVDMSGPAWRTVAAKHLRLHGNPVAHAESGYLAADPGDFAGALVSLHDGKRHVPVLAVIDLDIGTADANPPHPDQYLVLADLRRRRLQKTHLEGFRHFYLQHRDLHGLALAGDTAIFGPNAGRIYNRLFLLNFVEMKEPRIRFRLP